jgi:AcrR family transcriptional regulator
MKNEANRKKDSHGQDRPRSQGSNRQGSAGADAARALYALNPIEAVTVDDLIGEAVARKTFYVHFDGLAELQAAVADQLAHEFDELFSLAGWRPTSGSSELLRAAGRSSAKRSAILPGARSWPARGPIHAEHRAWRAGAPDRRPRLRRTK